MLVGTVTIGVRVCATFLDASTQQTKEIVLVTARTGDVITIVRGQQGTTARAWNAGDIAAQLVTAGDSSGMLQPDKYQIGTYDACVASGSANSIIASLPSGITVATNLLSFTVQSSAANTGKVTLTLTLGSIVLSALPVYKYGGSQLNAGDIPSANYPIELVLVSALGGYVMTNPATSTTGSVSGGVANNLLIQTAPGTTGFVPAPSVSGQVLAFISGVIQWVAAAVTSFNGRSGAVTAQSGDYTAAQVGAVSIASVTGANQQIATSGYQTLPGGIILQWGRISSTSDLTYVTFPKTFPNACFIVVPTGYTSNTSSTSNLQAFGYQGVSPCPSFTLLALSDERPSVWFAIGW